MPDNMNNEEKFNIERFFNEKEVEEMCFEAFKKGMLMQNTIRTKKAFKLESEPFEIWVKKLIQFYKCK